MLVRSSRLFYAFITAAVLACSSPRTEDSSDSGTNIDRKDAGNRGGTPDVPAIDPGQGPPDDPSCPKGQHKCGDTCVDNTAIANCAGGCTACPSVTGGTATCDGIKCGVSCPAGQKPCLTACVPEAMACDQNCPMMGQNNCGGICVDAKSLSTCGVMCLSCPTSPYGTASCDGDKCDLKCNAGYHKCGDACVSDTDIKNCGSSCSACEAPTGGTATCDGVKCGTSCPGGTTLCLGKCIPMGQACDGICVAGKHDCSGNCVSNSELANCGSQCMPCRPPENADATCDGTSCGFNCRAGFHLCNGLCKSNMSVDSCGGSCERCTAPSGGSPTCNGTSCDFRCDVGRRCGGSCINDDQPCNNACGNGRTLCMSSGKCVLSGTITAEKCDGLDNDCDGQIDEGVTDSCQNKCGTKGTARCVNGSWDRSSCPGDPQCCDNSDCGGCQTCSGGSCKQVSCNDCQECNNNHGCRDQAQYPGGQKTDYQSAPRSNGSWDWNCKNGVEVNEKLEVIDCNSGADPPYWCTPYYGGNIGDKPSSNLGQADCGRMAATFSCVGNASTMDCNSANHRNFTVKCR